MFLLASLAIQSVSLDRSVPLAPTGPWTVEVSEGLCLVGRTYGPNQQQPTLGFRQAPNAEDFEVGLWLNNTSKKGSYGTAQLRLDSGDLIEAEYIGGPVTIEGLHLNWIATKRSQLEALSTAKILNVRVGDFQADFNIGNVKVALKALRDCERDLLVSWGMDPAVLASIATRPRGNLASFFTTADYPSDAVRMRKEGTVGASFWVTTKGRLRDCKVVASSSSPLLDLRTCQVITRRGQIEPARTKDGVAVESLTFVRVRWFMPTR